MRLFNNIIQHFKNPFNKGDIHLKKNEKVKALVIGGLLAPFFIVPGFIAFYGITAYFKQRHTQQKESSSSKITDVSKKILHCENSEQPKPFHGKTYIKGLIEENVPVDIRVVKRTLKENDISISEFLIDLEIDNFSLFKNLIIQALKYKNKKSLKKLFKYIEVTDLKKICKNSKDPDHVIINVKGERLYFSKNFLILFMPHVSKWFTHFNTTTKQIELQDVDPNLFKKILYFVISKEDYILKINKENISEYIYLAGLLEIPEFSQVCKDWLGDNLDSFDLVESVEIFNDPSLRPTEAIEKKLANLMTRYYDKLSIEDNEIIRALLPYVTQLKFKEPLDSRYLNLLSEFENIDTLHLVIERKEDLQQLHSFKHLKGLHLSFTRTFTSDFLDFIPGLPIKSLDLRSHRLNAMDLETVCNCSRIENLSLSRLTPERFSKESLATLSRLSYLKELSIFGSSVLSDLPALPSLEKLYLVTNLEITDEMLLHLSSFPKLSRLALIGTKITDQGLLHLAQYPQLVEIDLSSTKTTTQGRSTLANNLPNCKIICRW